MWGLGYVIFPLNEDGLCDKHKAWIVWPVWLRLQYCRVRPQSRPQRPVFIWSAQRARTLAISCFGIGQSSWCRQTKKRPVRTRLDFIQLWTYSRHQSLGPYVFSWLKAKIQTWSEQIINWEWSVFTWHNGGHVGINDKSEEVCWEFDSIILQNLFRILLLFCIPTWLWSENTLQPTKATFPTRPSFPLRSHVKRVGCSVLARTWITQSKTLFIVVHERF